MTVHITSATTWGIEALRIEIEVDLSNTIPGMTIVGQPDKVVKESRDRVRAAIENTPGCKYPGCWRVLVNLAPARIPKQGPRFDLPIALAILAREEQVDPSTFEQVAVVGELAFDGRVRPVRGVLSMVAGLRDEGLEAVIVPKANGREAGVVDGIRVVPVETLQEAIGWLAGEKTIPPPDVDVEDLLERHAVDEVDMAEVKGQPFGKRAMELSAAGGHHVLLCGPPGSGKTMLFRRLPTILPPLTAGEAIDATRVHSVAGSLGSDLPLVARRPFRAPHHTASAAGIIGGGSEPRPGEISLAHRGVLFLDELPEFPRRVLEALRQPLEDGEVTIDRVAGRATFPARATVVAAMNPCPCGYYGCRDRECRCGPVAIDRYQNRISGPIRDRFDIQLVIHRIPATLLEKMEPEAPSSSYRERVVAARAVQEARYGSTEMLNGHLAGAALRRWATPEKAGRRYLAQMIDDLGLSARTYDRILRVSRTVADLEGSEKVLEEHVSEAMMLRCPIETMAA